MLFLQVFYEIVFEDFSAQLKPMLHVSFVQDPILVSESESETKYFVSAWKCGGSAIP